MKNENKNALPPECDEHGVPKPENRNTSIRLFDYFKTIEVMLVAGNVSPENAEQFIKPTAIRNVVGGRYSNAIDAYESYCNYVKETPEEVRKLDIPPAIRGTIDELFSYLAWYFRMSYKSIKDEQVLRLEATVNDLSSNCDSLSEQVSTLTQREASLQQTLQQFEDELTQKKRLLAETTDALEILKQSHDQQSILLKETELGKRHSDQIGDELRQQLSDRKADLTRQQDMNEGLQQENKKQQTEISELSHQLDKEKNLRVLATNQTEQLSVQIEALETNLSASEGQRQELTVHNEELEQRVNRLQSEFDAVSTTCESLRTELSTNIAENTQLNRALMQSEAQINAEKTINDSLRQTLQTMTQAVGGNNSHKATSRTNKRKATSGDENEK